MQNSEWWEILPDYNHAEKAWAKHVTQVINELQWKNEYIGIVYGLCYPQQFFSPQALVKQIRGCRWTWRLPEQQPQPMLQIGGSELPVTAASDDDWEKIVEVMIQQGIIHELDQAAADDLEDQYSESGAICTPLARPIEGQLALTKKGVETVRHFADTRLFGYSLFPRFSSRTGADVVVVRSVVIQQDYDYCQYVVECNWEPDIPESRGYLLPVGEYWETPFYHVSDGIGIIHSGRIIRPESYCDFYRGECPVP